VYPFTVKNYADRGILHVVDFIDVLCALSRSLGDSRTALVRQEADERSVAAELVRDQCST
jgi:hypothetical protein